MQDQRPFVARRVGTGRAVVGVRTGQLEDEAMEQDEKPGTLKLSHGHNLPHVNTQQQETRHGRT